MGPATALILDAKSKWNSGEGSCAGAAVFDDYPLIAGGPRGTSFARARLVLHFKWLCFFRLGSKQTRASVWSHARKFAAAGKNRGIVRSLIWIDLCRFLRARGVPAVAAIVASTALVGCQHCDRVCAPRPAVAETSCCAQQVLAAVRAVAPHAVISPIVLALLFYAAIVPIGLLKRIFGNDPLRLRADRAADSYWITRDSSESAPGSMKHQF